MLLNECDLYLFHQFAGHCFEDFPCNTEKLFCLVCSVRQAKMFLFFISCHTKVNIRQHLVQKLRLHAVRRQEVSQELAVAQLRVLQKPLQRAQKKVSTCSKVDYSAAVYCSEGLGGVADLMNIKAKAGKKQES